MNGAPVSDKNPTMDVIIGMRVVANVDEEGGKEEARIAMLCGVVILILRSNPRDNNTPCKFCMAWSSALGSKSSSPSSAVRYSLPTAIATTEVAGMKGEMRVENHSSAAEVEVLMLETW